MRYTFYMQQFACGARALHQHVHEGERGEGGEEDRLRHVYSHQHPYPVDRLQLTTYFNAIAFKSVVRASSLTVWAPVYVWVSLYMCVAVSLSVCVCVAAFVCVCEWQSLYEALESFVCSRRLRCAHKLCKIFWSQHYSECVVCVCGCMCVAVCVAVCGVCLCVCVGCAPFVHFETNKMKHFKVVNMQPIDILAVVCVCGS